MAAALLVALSATACLGTTEPNNGPPSNPATETYAASLGINIAQMTKLSDDLYYQDITVGTGAAVGPGKAMSVDYIGWLANGVQFDSNAGRGPYPFTLQDVPPDVIVGWDLGLVGMKVGGKRRLVIGSSLGFGPTAQFNASGVLVIPANATLIFDVTVLTTQ
jgi:FKBP-type peptidyl-prolyl cis-trans isomerase FkpA